MVQENFLKKLNEFDPLQEQGQDSSQQEAQPQAVSHEEELHIQFPQLLNNAPKDEEQADAVRLESNAAGVQNNVSNK